MYALRDIDHLKRLAASHGDAIGVFAAAILDHPLPWTKMRQVYALLGLVKKWGPERVDAACVRALDADAFNVPLIGRMIERAVETTRTRPPLVPGRFARPADHFATTASKRPHPGIEPGPDRALDANVEDGSEPKQSFTTKGGAA